MRRALVAITVLLFLSGSAVWLSANTIPTDPIIGTKGGGGTTPFFGTATFLFTDPNCFTSVGCQTAVFGNTTASLITSFLETFSSTQQGQPPFTVDPASLFQGIDIIDSANVILYSLSPSTIFFNNNCSFPTLSVAALQTSPCTPDSEFLLTFANVTPGTLSVTFSSNPPNAPVVPEPSTMALLASGVGAVGIGRRRWAKRA